MGDSALTPGSKTAFERQVEKDQPYHADTSFSNFPIGSFAATGGCATRLPAQTLD